MKIEFHAKDTAPVDAARLFADVKQAGAFVDHDGDLNIVTPQEDVICITGRLGGWAFIRSHDLREVINQGHVKRVVRPGETLTITF